MVLDQKDWQKYRFTNTSPFVDHLNFLKIGEKQNTN